MLVTLVHLMEDKGAKRGLAALCLGGGEAVYMPDFDGILEHLTESLAPGDLVVTMGAGNIWEVADDIVRWLGNDR